MSRRLFLGSAAAGVGTTAFGLDAPARAANATDAPAFIAGGRATLTSGVMSGDVSSSGATVWARADRPGRMVATLHSRGRPVRRLHGPMASEASDCTAKLDLRNLNPGRQYSVTLGFADERGRVGEQADASFRTAPTNSNPVSFVWTGDTAGQGWGINPDLGGMTAYRSMQATDPDFFIHSGDTIYADNPIAAEVVEPDGQVWRNLVIEEVSKVAETVHEFRGRHRYNLLDENIRAMYSEVPLLSQWDDHETTNNWYPGEILTDERYGEKRVDVLAARAKQAWWEYQPISNRLSVGRRSDPQNPGRIYRSVRYGRHLEVFCLDMRTHKSPNTPGLETRRTAILGKEQSDWLIRGVASSTATWKVIAADLPLGIIVPDGPVDQEAISNVDPGAPLGRELEIAAVLSAFKKHRVRNVAWVTADVHYAAAHHYSPARAAFTDFDPFWEFVAGPISAGAFGPNKLDPTFGPSLEFVKGPAYQNQSPRGGNVFFGHCAIERHGVLTVSLRNGAGTVLWSKALEPERL